MIIFEGAAVYDSISGILRISEDQASFDSPAAQRSFQLQFESDPRHRAYSYSHSFYLLYPRFFTSQPPWLHFSLPFAPLILKIMPL